MTVTLDHSTRGEGQTLRQAPLISATFQIFAMELRGGSALRLKQNLEAPQWLLFSA